MQLDNKFSWKTAIFMAKLAKHAYNSQAAFKKTFKKDWTIKMFSHGGTECYVLTCPKNYIVVFRGTEPTSWEDIKADVQFRKVGGIHRGFKAALDDVWDKLFDDYEKNAIEFNRRGGIGIYHTSSINTAGLLYPV